MLHQNVTSNVLGMPNGSSNTMGSSSNTITTGNGNSYNNSPLDALPKQFVLSMKKLFDILDDQHTGFVKLSDIEKGWQDDGSKGLPRGVIESLRKVTPPSSGLLSFERFCAGLKLCLLRNQQSTEPIAATTKSPTKSQHRRPPSAPLLEIENSLLCTAPTATIRPRSHAPIIAQRAISMPQLSPGSELDADFMRTTTVNNYNSPPPPPKPPRSSTFAHNAASASGLLIPNQTSGNLDKTEIRHALQNWQMNVLLNELDVKDKQFKGHAIQNHTPFEYRGSADGGSSSATDSNTGVAALQAKKSTTKRREPRRHTLQNGIDYNMLKRLKQFEEERELLLLGLDGVEKARDWYMQQVLNVQERIKYFGRLGTNFEQYSELHQERLNFQRARVFEVNRNLLNLVSSWERGTYPHHINLAIRTPNKVQPHHKRYTVGSGMPVVGENTLMTATGGDRLRQQNRQLSNELHMKSERIALLEREKQALISEMQQRFGDVHSARNVTGFVLSQPSPISQSSGGLGDADVVY